MIILADILSSGLHKRRVWRYSFKTSARWMKRFKDIPPAMALPGTFVILEARVDIICRSGMQQRMRVV
jgi:hypothetical protein